MARARNLKPASCENEVLAKLTPHVRLLWAFLPCHADCEGKLEDRPTRLHIKIFPYEPKLKFNDMLQTLHDKKFITRYEVDGEKFIWINKFLDHQSPTTKEKAKGSNIPDYDSNSHGTLPEHNGDNTGLALTLNPKPLTLNPKPLEIENKINEIGEYYKKNINPQEISSGKRNLKKIATTTNIDKLFQYVKNYHNSTKHNSGTQYKIRMRNFFGRDRRFEDYKEFVNPSQYSKDSDTFELPKLGQ